MSGADRVEFYTGPFAEAFDHSPQIGKNVLKPSMFRPLLKF
ncbi:pyridoxine 5'-phosphate synthase family protein [Leptospira interrogans serovar Grippotyphosa str. LT2186]|uniref:Pyridoxine 5'-phosphate synthase family protein n=1 Tax=Leptospira interrogans serovar Grippotyphosa str. LT2186 TaxID=1001599 RepID=M3IAV0_LEPIR|nr:pyridoxine 5'-phosphate synthase family protein [Leptospira interrogans serovar Grippotyphosa str. LT2186]